MTGTWLLAALAAALLRPSDLRVEYMIEPVTDEAHPRLSWVNEVRRGSGVSQSAYQIQVATDRRFRHKVWDSGKVLSGESHLIEYQGEPLQPGISGVSGFGTSGEKPRVASAAGGFPG